MCRPISPSLEGRAMIDTLIDAREVQGESEVETKLLASYREGARAHLESFGWCSEVRDERFGIGVGGVLAVFLMEVFVKGRAREWLWVVAGDLPAAYFPLPSAADPCAALRVYCELAAGWVEAVRSGARPRDAVALGVVATAEAAALLGAKLDTFQRLVLPALCAGREA
jgi:hypothetical protein